KLKLVVRVNPENSKPRIICHSFTIGKIFIPFLDLIIKFFLSQVVVIIIKIVFKLIGKAIVNSLISSYKAVITRIVNSSNQDHNDECYYKANKPGEKSSHKKFSAFFIPQK